MPIGAVIGGAVIGAGGSILAGGEAAGAQKDAAHTAADSSLQIANQNNQLFRDTRNQNIGIAAPFYNNGVAAGNALQGLLLGTPQAASTPLPTTGTLPASGALSTYTGGASQPGIYNPSIGVPQGEDAYGAGGFALKQTRADIRARMLDEQNNQQGALSYQTAPVVSQTPVPGATPAPGAGGTSGTVTSALSPWDQFRNSTNYQFRYDQGLKATEGNFATKGALDSGAAEKAKITFGQNFASNELSNYMNLLAGQQNVGLSAGNAIMGVSTSAANAIAGQNTNAGNVAANAALQSGQASANMWGTVGQTAGQLGGALFQYGMGQFKPQTTLPAAAGGYNVNSGTSNYFNSNPFGGGF